MADKEHFDHWDRNSFRPGWPIITHRSAKANAGGRQLPAPRSFLSLTPLLRLGRALPERKPGGHKRQREQRPRRAQAQRTQRAVIVLAAAAILLALAATLVKHHARKQTVVLVIRALGMVQ